MKVGIIDYGMGNLFSVASALETIGADIKICQNPETLKEVDRIILPGVGAFKDCIDTLTQSGFKEALNIEVLKAGKPIYGICLGMQIMARGSTEFGSHKGLGWIEGDVVPMQPKSDALRVPHVGWNNVKYKPDSYLFSDLPNSPDFYFVHSFMTVTENKEDILAQCKDEGLLVSAAIKRDNITGLQFHPEKSGEAGLKILNKFISL